MDRLVVIKEHYQYDAIIILDLNKNLIISTDTTITDIGQKTRSLLIEEKLNAATLNLHRIDGNQKTVLDFVATIYSPGNEILGYLILRSDPESFLLPLLKKWPTSSKSAETEIVEKSGDSVMVLNNRKYQQGTSLRTMVSMQRSNVVAVNAVTDGSRLFEGYDYRGVKTLSFYTPIKGTDWKMISKVDSDEIFQPLRNLALAFGLILTALLLFFGSVLLLIRNLYQKSYFKTLYDSEI